jgi:hypothetical protein
MTLGSAHAQSTTGTELKMADLTGKDIDVVVAILEVSPIDNLARNIHPGEEVVRA